MNGLFYRIFCLSHLWEIEMTKSQCICGNPTGLGVRGGDASPCPRRDGSSLTSTDTPCPNENKSYLVNKR